MVNHMMFMLFVEMKNQTIFRPKGLSFHQLTYLCEQVECKRSTEISFSLVKSNYEML